MPHEDIVWSVIELDIEAILESHLPRCVKMKTKRDKEF